MTHSLLIIDNPSGQRLPSGKGWFEALVDTKRTADRLLLVGFQDEDLVRIRQYLSPQLEETNIYSVTQANEAALKSVDATFFLITLQHLIAGLAPEKIHMIDCFGQPPRDFWKQLLQPLSTSTTHKQNNRLRLAFVSPLPPEPTGIANYSAELLPVLAKHYDITLVVDQESIAASLTSHFKIVDAATFATNAKYYDRILYQIGNSPYHNCQFELLRRHPGVVVLHDIFLCDVVWWLQESNTWPDGLRQQLFIDHGFPGALAMTDESMLTPHGPDSYPVNSFVTHEAAGLIYHSNFARDLDRHWRLDAWREQAAIIPHLRKLPCAATSSLRRKAREALGVEDSVCLIASFGGISPKKLSDLLVNTVLDADWAEAAKVQLVLVGAQHSGDFGRQLSQRIKRHPCGQRIRITGYVSHEDYRKWLQAADIAVQLRQQSRGESSGAIFDAMAQGLPLIVNAHGSSAELPSTAVNLLPDLITQSELSLSLRSLVMSNESRQVLGEAARAFVAQTLDPPSIAAAYHQAIENFAGQTRREHQVRRTDALAGHLALQQLDMPDLMEATRTLCQLDTTAPTQLPRILFDISTIAWHDLKTGIERVTRRLADQLLRHPPAGWRVELIRWGGDDFHLARGFASDQLGIEPPVPDRPCEARAGDIYVSVEWAPPLLEQAGDALKQMRARGVRCYFTVHDLLPLYLPEYFPEDTPERMRTWFERIAERADGITCVSATVADNVRHELAALDLPSSPWVEHFHLGADFSGADAGPLAHDEQHLLQAITQPRGPTLLMVGTLEPRKGHCQVLEAIENCWDQGIEVNLCIVGKQGWDVDSLSRRLCCHSQNNLRLHWVEGASDALLARLYTSCDGLVAASFGEGFGLPLIEAAHHGIPILARDIPVFREVAGEHADYFSANDAKQLAQDFTAWIERWQSGELAGSRGMPHHDWAASAQQWLGHILADQPTPLAVGQPQPVEPNS
ncbi:MAG: glycosyltransferase [Halomonas sp.]|uniref:glycosyltransferase n=1 Tax=Halomonas sp. TaxID=1486246 RepID=UPI003F8E6A6B